MCLYSFYSTVKELSLLTCRSLYFLLYSIVRVLCGVVHSLLVLPNQLLYLLIIRIIIRSWLTSVEQMCVVLVMISVSHGLFIPWTLSWQSLHRVCKLLHSLLDLSPSRWWLVRSFFVLQVSHRSFLHLTFNFRSWNVCPRCLQHFVFRLGFPQKGQGVWCLPRLVQPSALHIFFMSWSGQVVL